MNEKTIHNMNDIHVGRNVRKADLLQSSILPYVCVSRDDMNRSGNHMEMRSIMGLFDGFFVEVKRGSKITYSESDLRKWDRTYEKEILADDRRRVMSPSTFTVAALCT